MDPQHLSWHNYLLLNRLRILMRSPWGKPPVPVPDKKITRKSQLIKALEGTTKDANEIAEAIRRVDINVRILSKDSFAKSVRKK